MSSTLQPWQIYLAINGALAAASIPLYLLVPKGSSMTFHPLHTPISEDHKWWVQAVASGDALAAAVCYYGVRSSGFDASIRQFCLSSFAVYGVFHFAAFSIGKYLNGDKKSSALLGFFAVLPVGAYLYWR